MVCWILIIVFEEVALPDFLQSFDLELGLVAFNILRFEDGNWHFGRGWLKDRIELLRFVEGLMGLQ